MLTYSHIFNYHISSHFSTHIDPPVVTVNPHNLTINETEEILLFCGYESNPNSLTSVRWFRDDEIINLNQTRIDGGNTEQTALLSMSIIYNLEFIKILRNIFIHLQSKMHLDLIAEIIRAN